MRARCVAQNVVACLVNDGVHIILLKLVIVYIVKKNTFFIY